MQAIRNSKLTKILGLLALVLALNVVGSTVDSKLPIVGTEEAEAGGNCILKFCETSPGTWDYVCRSRIGAEQGNPCGSICSSFC